MSESPFLLPPGVDRRAAMADAPGRPNPGPGDFTAAEDEQLADWAAGLDAAVASGDYDTVAPLPRLDG